MSSSTAPSLESLLALISIVPADPRTGIHEKPFSEHDALENALVFKKDDDFLPRLALHLAEAAQPLYGELAVAVRVTDTKIIIYSCINNGADIAQFWELLWEKMQIIAKKAHQGALQYADQSFVDLQLALCTFNFPRWLSRHLREGFPQFQAAIEASTQNSLPLLPGDVEILDGLKDAIQAILKAGDSPDRQTIEKMDSITSATADNTFLLETLKGPASKISAYDYLAPATRLFSVAEDLLALTDYGKERQYFGLPLSVLNINKPINLQRPQIPRSTQEWEQLATKVVSQHGSKFQPERGAYISELAYKKFWELQGQVAPHVYPEVALYTWMLTQRIPGDKCLMALLKMPCQASRIFLHILQEAWPSEPAPLVAWFHPSLDNRDYFPWSLPDTANKECEGTMIKEISLVLVETLKSRGFASGGGLN